MRAPLPTAFLGSLRRLTWLLSLHAELQVATILLRRRSMISGSVIYRACICKPLAEHQNTSTQSKHALPASMLLCARARTSGRGSRYLGWQC